MLSQSILAQKASDRKIVNIYAETLGTQLYLFKETIEELEDYLDTGDLSQLTKPALGVIKNDVLDLIKGFRGIKRKRSPDILKIVSSVDGVLEYLRASRDILFEIEGMFDRNQNLMDNQRGVFFPKLSECRKNLADALKLFLPKDIGG